MAFDVVVVVRAVALFPWFVVDYQERTTERSQSPAAPAFQLHRITTYHDLPEATTTYCAPSKKPSRCKSSCRAVGAQSLSPHEVVIRPGPFSPRSLLKGQQRFLLRLHLSSGIFAPSSPNCLNIRFSRQHGPLHGAVILFV